MDEGDSVGRGTMAGGGGGRVEEERERRDFIGEESSPLGKSSNNPLKGSLMVTTLALVLKGGAGREVNPA